MHHARARLSIDERYFAGGECTHDIKRAWYDEGVSMFIPRIIISHRSRIDAAVAIISASERGNSN